jgi:hypothetical protein
MTIMHLAASPWYTSATFYGASTLIATVVIGLAAILVPLLVTSTKRLITYHLAQDEPLLTAAAALPQAEIQVIVTGNH